MSREVFALRLDDSELPPLVPEKPKHHFKQKRNLAKARAWCANIVCFTYIYRLWKPFVNSARKDEVQFCHWAKAAEDTKGLWLLMTLLLME